MENNICAYSIVFHRNCCPVSFVRKIKKNILKTFFAHEIFKELLTVYLRRIFYQIKIQFIHQKIDRNCHGEKLKTFERSKMGQKVYPKY